jgi:tetratricopeptide (TPR) repeat protein
MKTEIPPFSSDFQQLYCDAAVFDPFSALHPISFRRVLPFQAGDPVVDDQRLVCAEQAHLLERNDDTRRAVVDAYFNCGLLEKADADNLKSVIDLFGFDFFELMGLLYANAGMFICALRWYREFVAELETNPRSGLDNESVYASVGYCLYGLGLFPEAISWSKSCIGPRPTADAVCQALINYEAELAGGTIRSVECAASRTRYTVSAFEEARASQSTPRLKAALTAFAPFQEIYIDWVNHDAPAPEIEPDGYPFRVERDASSLPRHKMNLIFATCGQADALAEKGYTAEARRLLHEAALLEPAASIVQDRIKALP